MIKIKIKNGSILKKQSLLWQFIFVLFLIGGSFVIGHCINDYTNINFIIITGCSLITIGIFFSVYLISECIKPHEQIIDDCKLVMVKEITGSGKYIQNNDIGYRLTFYYNNRNIKLFISLQNNIDLIMSLQVLLKNNESYKLKYLTKSKIITEIENITNPEIDEYIHKYFEKNQNKKQRKKSSEIFRPVS